jgi:lantibiotic biosynthesis protein
MKEHEKNMNLEFLDKLVLRVPALPYAADINPDKITELINDKAFLEAIYMASPVLYKECLKWKQGILTDDKEIGRIKTSLIKYYQRMCSRCTPFGLFAGCAIVNWDKKETSILLTENGLYRKTRPDMHYLCALAQHLAALPFTKNRLHYFPNNSIYKTGYEFRFIEYKYESSARMHQISSVQVSDYIELVLGKAASGITTDKMIDLLCSENEVTKEEASEFIDELISAQVLISELDPSITGSEFTQQIIDKLKKINNPESAQITQLLQSLELMAQSIKTIDDDLTNDIDAYNSLNEKIMQLGITFDESKLLQTDKYFLPAGNTVNEIHKADLLKSITILLSLSSLQENDNLTSFIEKFRNRYEDKLVPLLNVLDTESGIGYGNQTGRNLSPLIEKIALPANKDRYRYDVKWNSREEWLFTQLINAGNKKQINLDSIEFPETETKSPPLPVSLSVMFSFVEDGNILFKGANGPGANCLLGRFAHGNEEINQLAKEVAQKEQEINNDIVFAEIIHLPEDRVGNILLHPAFYQYEIPFLAQSSFPKEQQVSLQDLYIGVRNGKVYLYSYKLGKEILPRLSSAHNYSNGSLPVYHFLADMQTQGIRNSLAFSWGAMSRHFKFLPRATAGNIILQEATWQLEKKDFEVLLLPGAIVDGAVDKFRQQWDLPPLMLLADADNELLINWENNYSVDAFIKTIKNRPAILLKEFLRPDAAAVVNENNQAYCNQFVAVLINTEKLYNGALLTLQHSSESAAFQRAFIPGSEWFYYKIYCGTQSADEILAHSINSLTEQLLKQGLIDKWFFIRYTDPSFHLRLRLHLKDQADTTAIINLLFQHFQPLIDKGQVWKVMADTYDRETERYGHELTAIAEDLFFYDSKLKIEFLQLTEGDEREHLRWLWGMRGIDELLNAFGFSIEKKYELLIYIQASFFEEFGGDKQLQKQLNSRYTEHRRLIEEVMQYPASQTSPLYNLIYLFTANAKEQNDIASSILKEINESRKEVSVENLLGSYIHMNLNRLFLSEPRQHELVIYSLMVSWYQSIIKRK